MIYLHKFNNTINSAILLISDADETNKTRVAFLGLKYPHISIDDSINAIN